MASGSLSTKTGTGLELSVDWSSQSHIENYSTVTENIYLEYYALSCGARYDQEASINEKSFKYNTSSIKETDNRTLHRKLLATFSHDVYHNDDGTKKCKIKASWKFNGTYNGRNIGTLNIDNEITLDNIPRTSKINNFNDFNIEDTFNIDVTKYSDSFTDTLNIKMGNTTIKTIENYISGQNISFSSSELTNIYNQMKTIKFHAFIAEIITKSQSDNKVIGYTDATATGTISNANPIISESDISYNDTLQTTINITGDSTKIIQNQSNLVVNVSKATAQKQATIEDYQVIVNGVKLNKKQPGQFSFGKVDSSQNIDLEVIVTDSRGNYTQLKKTITMIAYSEPTAQITLDRVNNYEDETHLKVNASYSSLNNKNSISIKWYKSPAAPFLRNLKVGDNLNNATLYLNFPDRAIDFFGTLEFDGGNNTLLTTSGGSLKAFADSSSQNYSIDVRNSSGVMIKELYRNIGGSSTGVDTNLKVYNLPSNFGIVQSIDKKYDFYKYIQIYESDSQGTVNNNTQVSIDCDKESAWVIMVEITDIFSSRTYNCVLNKGVFTWFVDVGLNSIGLNQFPIHQKAAEFTGDIYFNDIIQNKCSMLPAGNLRSSDYWRNIQQGKYFYNNVSGSSNAPSTKGYIEVFRYESSFNVIWYSTANNNQYRLYGDADSISNWISF